MLQHTNAPETLEELKFTPEEIARSHKLHPTTVRRMFLDEAGVIRMGHGSGRGRRQYYTLRIPASVVRRVFARMTVPGAPARRVGGA
jgi:hypothetical protein